MQVQRTRNIRSNEDVRDKVFNANEKFKLSWLNSFAKFV